MSKKREFGEGVIYTVSNYVWWFLLGNFYFWLMNIPFIFIVFTMGLSGEYNINLILILSLIPMGPAFTALLSVMGKITREGDTYVSKDFFKAYKVNFLDSLFFSGLGVIILTVIWGNIIFFNNNSKMYFLGIILRIILLVCLALGLYIFPIISRFYLKKKDVFNLSYMYLIKKMHICLIVFAAIFGMRIIFTKINSLIIVLFSASIICYVIMFFEKGMLQEIEEEIEIKDNSVQ